MHPDTAARRRAWLHLPGSGPFCTFRERPTEGAGVEEKGQGNPGALRPEEAGTVEGDGVCGSGPRTALRSSPADRAHAQGGPAASSLVFPRWCCYKQRTETPRRPE